MPNRFRKTIRRFFIIVHVRPARSLCSVGGKLNVLKSGFYESLGMRLAQTQRRQRPGGNIMPPAEVVTAQEGQGFVTMGPGSWYFQ